MSYLSNHRPEELDRLNGRGPAPDPLPWVLTEEQHAELAEHGQEPLTEAEMDALYAEYLAHRVPAALEVDQVYLRRLEEEARAQASGECG